MPEAFISSEPKGVVHVENSAQAIANQRFMWSRGRYTHTRVALQA